MSGNKHQNVLRNMLDELQQLDREVDVANINALIYAIHVINENEMIKSTLKRKDLRLSAPSTVLNKIEKLVGGA